MVRDDVPNETQRSVVLSFMQPGQEEVLRPYLEKYLEIAETLWEEKGTQRASTALEFLFPRPLASPELLERVPEGDKALVFTQYPGFDRLVPYLHERLGAEVGFFHGRLTARQREEVLEAFEKPDGPQV